jgi:hypothetical protein
MTTRPELWLVDSAKRGEVKSQLSPSLYRFTFPSLIIDLKLLCQYRLLRSLTLRRNVRRTFGGWEVTSYSAERDTARVFHLRTHQLLHSITLQDYTARMDTQLHALPLVPQALRLLLL